LRLSVMFADHSPRICPYCKGFSPVYADYCGI
jgi:hypothetical protein